MGEVVIYVAGNPDAYPIEYYDAETQSFQGMIPELLREFSGQTQYDIRYYKAEKTDERQQLAQNVQVDVISGCTQADAFRHLEGEEIYLLETAENGETVTYQLFVTKAAPEKFAADLRAFIAQKTQSERIGTLIKVAEQNPPSDKKAARLTLWGMAFCILLLLFAVLFIAFKYRRRLEALKKDNEADSLTGIGNHKYLLRYYKTYINDKNRILYSMFYFFIDTDRIDRVYGRAQTNEFLRGVAIALQDYTADADILARISDSCFVILRLSVNVDEELQWLGAALNRVKGVFAGNERDDSKKVAVGVYNMKLGDRDLDDVIFKTGRGAQSAYQRGEDYIICTDQVLFSLEEEQRLQSEVRRGLENEEFQLYIQFYLETATSRIVGGECLSRWEHPDKGLLMPGRFVPLMEREHLISQLDYYIMEKACAFLEELCRDGKDDFFLSCNFSRETASADGFLKSCREIIEKYEFPRELLIVEVKEENNHEYTAAMDKLMRKNIQGLKEIGVGVILNDFGEGFAYFAKLQDYPIDGFKLDRSLINSIGRQCSGSSLNAVIQVCHELDLTTIAVGVETWEQVDFLREKHCDVVQGFYFYHPLPDWEVRRMLFSQGADNNKAAGGGKAV